MSTSTKNLLKALLAASFALSASACADKCLRNTDCDNGASCLLGACVITLKGDASVASLTPTPPAEQPVEPAIPPSTPVSDAGAAIDGSGVAP